MSTRRFLPFVLASGAALALVAASSSPAVAPSVTAAEAGTYALDAVHSSVVFKIKHMDLADFYGRFNQVSGELTLAEDPADSKVRVELDTTSVDTANEGRDDHIKGPEFLDVLQFPKAVFESTKVTAEGDLFQVTGNLELHGKTQEVTLEMKKVGARDVGERFGGFKVGFDGSLSIDRRAFGIETYPDEVLGSTIELSFGIEAAKQ